MEIAQEPTLGGAAVGTATRIRAFNDLLRINGVGGRTMLTRGIAALSKPEIAAIMAAVRSFDGFDSDNDPHGEHDCAVLTVGEHRVIWKIDYFDTELLYHSSDASNADVTCRVLTVMLAEEY